MTTRLAEGNAGSQFDGAWSGSLNAAVARLEDVIARAPVVEAWCTQLEAALRECSCVVQYHLETLDGEDGMREHIAREEPRLIYRLERLDGELQRLLPELLDARQSSAGLPSVLTEPLAHLVAELHHADNDELQILFESLTPVGTGD